MSYEFDYEHKGGAEPWPKTHSGMKFGPSLIRKCWEQGLCVYAEVAGFPLPIAVREARWNGAGFLEVKTLEGWRIAARLFTRPDAKGLTASGLLVE